MKFTKLYPIVFLLISTGLWASPDDPTSFTVNNLPFKISPLLNWHIDVLNNGWSNDTTWNVQYNYNIDKRELGANIYIKVIERDTAIPQIDDRNIGVFKEYKITNVVNNEWHGYRVSYNGKAVRKCKNCGLFYRIFYVYTLSDKHNLVFTFSGHGSSASVDSLVQDFTSIIQPFFDTNRLALERFLLFNEPVTRSIQDSLNDLHGSFRFTYNSLYIVTERDTTSGTLRISQEFYLHSPASLTIHRKRLQTFEDPTELDLTSLYMPLLLSNPSPGVITYVQVKSLKGNGNWYGWKSYYALPYNCDEAELQVCVAKRYRDPSFVIWEYTYTITCKVLDGSLNLYYLRVLNRYVSGFEKMNQLSIP